MSISAAVAGKRLRGKRSLRRSGFAVAAGKLLGPMLKKHGTVTLNVERYLNFRFSSLFWKNQNEKACSFNVNCRLCYV